jgi:tetratricopeptide (TPR) repeat protein
VKLKKLFRQFQRKQQRLGKAFSFYCALTDFLLFCLFFFYCFRKQKGNDFYKNKNYSSAISAYSTAISLEPANTLLYTNRAAAYLMTLQYKEAISDCDKSISIDSTNSKAFFRKATGLKGLGNLNSAIEVLSAGLLLDPTNSVAVQEKKLLEACKNKIGQVKGNLEKRQYSAAVLAADQVIKDIGNSNNRELNLLKVKAFLALKRNEEALNLTNSMVMCCFSCFLTFSLILFLLIPLFYCS